MKKSIVFCLCIAVIALFAACNKEGVYNPSKKIQKVYELDDGQKVLIESWHWDGKLLTSIDSYTGLFTNTTKFSYDDKNRLIRTDDGNFHSNFIYDGNKISSIETYYYERLVATTTIEHSGNKISTIKFDVSLFDKAGVLNPLRFIIPEIAPVMENVAKKCSQEAKGENATMNLTWGGNNVKTVDLVYAGFGEHVTETIDISYDNKSNPTYGLFSMLSSDAVSNFCLNKNNPVALTIRVGSVVRDRMNYTYEYEGNYPTKVTCVSIEDVGTEDEDSDSSITFLEY
jgi:hypothetical protein